MDSAGQMAAMEGMGEMGAEDTQSEDMMTKATAACEAHPDMMLGEAMETMGSEIGPLGGAKGLRRAAKTRHEPLQADRGRSPRKAGQA
jgi:hypothetical protein